MNISFTTKLIKLNEEKKQYVLPGKFSFLEFPKASFRRISPSFVLQKLHSFLSQSLAQIFFGDSKRHSINLHD